MAIVALLDPDAPTTLQVAWALWFARARSGSVTLLLPKAAGQQAERDAAAAVAEDARFELREGDEEPAADDAEDEAAADDAPLACRVRSVAIGEPEAVLAAVANEKPELLLVLLAKVEAKHQGAARLGAEVLPRVPCAVVVVDLGDGRWPVAHLMVAASRGAHPRAALKFAHRLAVAAGGRLTGAYVEPDIGRDAQSVGRHVLARVLRSGLGDDGDDVGRQVVVDGSVDAGLQRAAEAAQPDAIVLGMPRPGVLGPRFYGLAPARVCKRVDLPVIIHRRPLPIGSRLRRVLEDVLQRFVPQLERETRVELAARVQSSSAWNFDFVALISLSTVIAALGLLQNSAAVIIGAMLIAPLMTPILGVGLALAQGNAMLARLAVRAIVYGVGTSFVLAVVVGLVDIWSHPLVVTDEMVARGWPGLMDLIVAFVSGLAAAYAHSRPGLFAALPGVAIAAALVPPIATSGLAFAAWDLRLAYGSLLLFITNMVAIVLAAGLSLWIVGVRKQGDDGWLRHLGNALVVIALLLTVHLTQRTRFGPIPVRGNVAAAVRTALPQGLLLLGVTARRGEQQLVVTVRVGGAAPPATGLADRLRQAVAPQLDEPVAVHLQYVWQQVASAPASPDPR